MATPGNLDGLEGRTMHALVTSQRMFWDDDLQAVEERVLIAVDGCTRLYGPDHVYTLTSMHMLGAVHLRQRRFDSARTTLRVVVAGCERVLGANNSYTMAIASHLELTERYQSLFEEAAPEALQQQTGREQNLGIVVQGLVSQGRYDAAEGLVRQVLSRHETLFGWNDPRTFECVGRLGFVLWKQEKYDEAGVELERAMERHEALFGQEDARRVECMHRLSSSRGDEGKFVAYDAQGVAQGGQAMIPADMVGVLY
jgi:hypothetical protein